MNRSLEPVQAAFRLNLEQQKNRAKELLRAVKAGDARALARMPGRPTDTAHAARAADFKLADAQFAIARELRFENWAALKSHILAMSRMRAAIESSRAALDANLKTLHIRCGSDIRQRLLDAGFAGDFLEHSYPYTQGPVTRAPDFLEQQARFVTHVMTGERDLSFEQALEGFRQGELQLAESASTYERIVLWMEHDSYDQLVLVRCLAQFASTGAPRVLELISVDQFPGSIRFIGLGQLPAEALRLLWQRRQPVTSTQLAIGTAAWNALTSDDPRDLVALMRTNTPALPHLAPALHRHLRQLPSVENGLSLTEHLTLQLLSEATGSIQQLFWRLQLEREPLPWLGDSGFRDIVESMARAAESVLTITRAEGEGVFEHQVAITDLGRAVLRGERDWMSLRPPPRWVGGVHIRPGEACWRWQEARQTAVLR